MCSGVRREDAAREPHNHRPQGHERAEDNPAHLHGLVRALERRAHRREARGLRQRPAAPADVEGTRSRRSPRVVADRAIASRRRTPSRPGAASRQESARPAPVDEVRVEAVRADGGQTKATGKIGSAPLRLLGPREGVSPEAGEEHVARGGRSTARASQMRPSGGRGARTRSRRPRSRAPRRPRRRRRRMLVEVLGEERRPGGGDLRRFLDRRHDEEEEDERAASRPRPRRARRAPCGERPFGDEEGAGGGDARNPKVTR